MTYQDPYLEVEESMGDAFKTRFMEAAIRRFPNLEGAHAADILDILDQHDWECETIEDIYEENKDFPGYAAQRTLVRVAVIAAMVLEEDAAVVVPFILGEPRVPEPIHGDDLPRPGDEPDVPMAGDTW